jgi:hypothetical protein
MEAKNQGEPGAIHSFNSLHLEGKDWGGVKGILFLSKFLSGSTGFPACAKSGAGEDARPTAFS